MPRRSVCMHALTLVTAILAVSASGSRIQQRIVQRLREKAAEPTITLLSAYESSEDATSVTEAQVDLQAVSFSLSAWLLTSNGGIILTNAASNETSARKGNVWYVKGELVFQVAENTAIKSTTPVQDGHRHFAVLTCTYESTGEHTYRIYVDGGEEVQLTMSPQTGTGQTFYIGKTNLVDNLPAGIFNGTMEDVTWYSTALSQQKVVDLYKAGLPAAEKEYVEGLQGDKGDTGTRGDNGAQGNLGQPGVKGEPGGRGAAGPAGADGVGDKGEQGPKGGQGEKGDGGTQGYPGAKGDPGTTGPSGAQGPAGGRGDPGPKGGAGDVGPMGPAGEPGAKGADGRQGGAGVAGGPGDKGDKGEQGAKGNAGTNGIMGQDGAPGVTGAGGAVGPRGDRGSSGPSGPMGPSGAQGVQGARGNAGVAGPPGALGARGVAGNRGYTGDRGSAGPKGASGGRGPQGLLGPAGESGEQGMKGDSGPKGDAGDIGTQGKKGSTGDKGAQGLVGEIGSIYSVTPQAIEAVVIPEAQKAVAAVLGGSSEGADGMSLEMTSLQKRVETLESLVYSIVKPSQDALLIANGLKKVRTSSRTDEAMDEAEAEAVEAEAEEAEATA